MTAVAGQVPPGKKSTTHSTTTYFYVRQHHQFHVRMHMHYSTVPRLVQPIKSTYFPPRLPGYRSDRTAYEDGFRTAPSSPVREVARDAAIAVWGAGTPLRDKGTLPKAVEKKLDEKGKWFCVTCLYSGEGGLMRG